MTLLRWLVPLFLLAACATNPVTKNEDFVLMSEQQELELGQLAAAQIAKEMPLLPENAPLSRYVDKVGQKVAATSDRPSLFYRFHVVDDSTINAFALPGGYIYIYRGLLEHLNSEAELAAVLGHEIGHVAARHAVKRYTQAQAYNLGMTVTSIFVPIPQGTNLLTDLIATAVIQGYGRDAELQADKLSLTYLARAGYDPHATIGILETLKRLDDIDAKEKKDAGDKVEQYHGAFASHPETRQRIEDAIREAAAMQGGGGIVDHADMLKAVDGYPYAGSTEQGAMIGRRFLHPDLGIQLEFPPEWIVENTPAALVARLRQKDAYFSLAMKELVKRQSAGEILSDIVAERKRIGPIVTGVQDGFDYAHVQANVSLQHVSEATADIWIFLRGPKAFRLIMWCKRDEFGKYQPDFASIAGSFRSYDKVRDGDIPRIALYTWKAGDSWTALAARSRNILGRFTADKLAVLNGMDVKQAPEPGTLVKIVR
ncbi:MAG TPA: M48 family metalloprotease [Mariprofundaceae bacterium]|nr:M48 family metalloprotease [Mariprofundaceae bacterium]